MPKFIKSREIQIWLTYTKTTTKIQNFVVLFTLRFHTNPDLVQKILGWTWSSEGNSIHFWKTTMLLRWCTIYIYWTKIFRLWYILAQLVITGDTSSVFFWLWVPNNWQIWAKKPSVCLIVGHTQCVLCGIRFWIIISKSTFWKAGKS